MSRKIEALLLDSANEKTVSLSQEVYKLYRTDIHMQKLQLHFQCYLMLSKLHLYMALKFAVMRVQTICDILNEQTSVKNAN